MAFFHAATEPELADLRLFEGSREYIDERISDRSDVILNWTIVGVEPFEGGRRALLNERSTLALAFIEGDGERFGRVVAPPPDEVADILRRFGVHWTR